MSDNTYLVTCISGQHVLEVIPGTELETKCKKREPKGFIDALCLDYSECSDCVEETRRAADRNDDYLSLFGCPMAGLDGTCNDVCPCMTDNQALESPYANQVRGLPVTA
ncbi:MAG: hypothetical protein WBP12_02515 [Candidatus Saccharimonas sp.]